MNGINAESRKEEMHCSLYTYSIYLFIFLEFLTAEFLHLPQNEFDQMSG